MTTPGAKALFPESHPLSLRTYGLAGCAWPAFYLNPQKMDCSRPSKFDVLVVLASSLGGLGTDKWDERLTPSRAMVQVDLDQQVIGRSFPVEPGVVAEIGAFLDDLMTYADNFTPDNDKVEARRSFIAQIKAEHSPYRDPASRDSEASPVLPQALMKVLSELLPPGSHLFIDAGNCVGWSLHYLEIDPPTQVHSALGMGPMGFGVAAVIGAKIGAPDQDCVALVGDGAFLMHGNEISTAARHNVGAVWVVLYDNDLNMVSQGMANFFPDPSNSGDWKGYYDIGKPDLVRFSESLGADSLFVASLSDFRTSFPEALGRARTLKKPQVLVVKIDVEQIPPYYVNKQ